MINTHFRILQNEVEAFHNKIIELSNADLQIKNLYKGCQILYSPLFINPKILLIGFNPGAGFYNSEKKIVEKFEAMPRLEYYLSNHSLANQTKKLFIESGTESVLKEETLKINFYFFATSNVSDFKKLTQFLPIELRNELFHQARVWTKKMIEMMNPEIIICEGISAFEEVSALYSNKTDNIENKFFKQFTAQDNRIVFGYYRNQGSILNKSEIAKALNKIL